MDQIASQEDVAERIRVMDELDEERRKQGAGILLSSVLKVEEGISHVSRSRFTDPFDILDY